MSRKPEASLEDVASPVAWIRFMADARARLKDDVPLEVSGTLTRLTGLMMEAQGLRAAVGAQCEVRQAGQPPVTAEVVGFTQGGLYLMPAGDVHGMRNGAQVAPARPYVPAPVLGLSLIHI